MNKKKAKLMIENHKVSFEMLNEMVNEAAPTGDVCSLNPSLTKADARKVFLGALDGRSGPVIPFRYCPYKNREVPSHDHKLATNILREFG